MESQTYVLGFSVSVIFFFVFFYHLKNSFSKTHYLPFNQLPIISPKGSEMKRETKLGSHSFFPRFICKAIENIVQIT